MVANSEPAISHLQLDISNFNHILRKRLQSAFFLTQIFNI